MRKNFLFLFVVSLFLFFSGSAMAIPSLQLYIEDGEYDTGSETWVVNPTSGSFILTAFAMDKDLTDSNQGNAFEGDSTAAFLIASLTPKLDDTGSPTDLYGTLGINGNSYNEWTFGPDTIPEDIPTVLYEAYTDVGVDEIPDHGIFDTYYIIHPFLFEDSGDFIFDTQPPNPDTEATKVGYRKNFNINLTGLNAELFEGVHFDLFTLDSESNLYKFAPFSHDAESRVSEPGTMLLLGTGLILIAGIGRKFFKN